MFHNCVSCQAELVEVALELGGEQEAEESSACGRSAGLRRVKFALGRSFGWDLVRPKSTRARPGDGTAWQSNTETGPVRLRVFVPDLTAICFGQSAHDG